MADTLLMARPFSGKRARIPPKREPFPLIQGERVLWKEYLPPFDLQRIFKRMILIGRGVIVFLLIGLLMSITLVILLSSIEIAAVIAIAFFPIFVILIWQIGRYVNATNSYEELRARYPVPAQIEYQEYFIVTSNRVISKSRQNFSQTSPGFIRDIASYDGDVFTGYLASLTGIQVKIRRSNKIVLRLKFEQPNAAVPEWMYLSKNNYVLTSSQDSWYFFPDLARNLASFLYYSSLFATKHNFTVTLDSTNVREICQTLQMQAPQATMKIS